MIPWNNYIAGSECKTAVQSSVAVLSLAASPPVARSFADLTYEPDSLVEDVVARAALAYYRLDLGERELNPYKKLFEQGDHNEEERLRWVMLRRPVRWLTSW
jgi:hypothetical protein